jgi:MFS family permease
MPRRALRLRLWAATDSRIMSQATELRLPVGRRGGLRVIAAVSAAHFISHYYILVLPPLFVFVRAEYDVSYVELGLALTAFNTLTTALQTPAGFLVDRVGARLVLIGGVALGAAALAIAGLINSFWVLVAMFAVAGVGNAVYHPADYNLLSHHVAGERIGQAFSIHTFSGLLGAATAPASLLFMQSLVGWRGAFVGAAILGFAVAIILALQSDNGRQDAPTKNVAKRVASGVPDRGWRLLLSWSILLNLIYFVLFAIANAGMHSYSLVALGALHQTPLSTANAALTGYLVMSAVGVLAGGWLVGHTARYRLLATQGLLALGVVAAIVSFVDLDPPLLVTAFSLGGFLFGITMPPRDMLVREVTPPGSFGKVFGFVTTGFNIGGIFSPLIFGALMDHGAPQWVFLLVTISSLLSIATVSSVRRAAA